MRYQHLFIAVLFFAISSCASLPDNSDRAVSYAFTDTAATSLGKRVAQFQYDAPDQDGIFLLGNGLDAFTARAILAEAAERSLDVQYYLYHDDLIGHLFSATLWKAAERGVRVRLLIDDMDTADRDAGLTTLDSHPNIEVRVFNPFDRKIARAPQFITGFGSVTRRMHNKSFTADNVASILGGRNIGNEYFEADPSLHFADLDVLAIGNVVRDVSSAFDLYWNSTHAYPIASLVTNGMPDDEIAMQKQRTATYLETHETSAYIQALRHSALANTLREGTLKFSWGKAEVLVDNPDKISQSRDADHLHLASQLAPHFEQISKELIIISPYFVPGNEGVEFFESLINKGISIKILTNSLASNDVGIVHAGYSNYRQALLKAGVELFELNQKLTREERKKIHNASGSSTASLHAKTFILDRKKIFIGSLNLDPRSFYENTEIGLIVEQQELASIMADRLVEMIENTAFRLELVSDGDDEHIIWHGVENGKPVSYDVEPHTSFWRRLGVGIMSLLPIESQL